MDKLYVGPQKHWICYINMWYIYRTIVIVNPEDMDLIISGLKIFTLTTQKPPVQCSAESSDKTIAYDPLTLKCIRDNMQHDHRYKILPFSAVSMVRKLKLNHKKINKRESKRKCTKQNGSNRSNLISTKNNGSRGPPNLECYQHVMYM